LAHAHAHETALQPEKLTVGPVAARLGIPGLLVGIIALVLAAWIGLRHPGDEQMVNHFFYSYLTSFSFFMAITLGALLFVLIQHLTRAGWSVTVRRLAEGLSLNMFLLVLLLLVFFIPVNGENGVWRMFEWLHPDVVAYDEILTAKRGYLNPQFFAIRIALYFVFFTALAWYYANKSRQQDISGDPKISIKLDKLGTVLTILFGYSLTSFAFDWIMSLNPHWFSTIFGVYYFAGAFLSALATIVLLALSLQKRGLLGRAVTHEHYHDLGKLMFAFTFFWGYIAFAQYMLIWYSDIPEETQFFIPRQIGHWGSISLLLLFVHVLIPFPGLLSRHVKRRNRVLAFWSVWTLCACALDQFWLVIPNEWTSRIPEEVGNARMTLPSALPMLVDTHHHIYQLSPAHQGFAQMMYYPLQAGPVLVTALCFVGIGGLYLFSTMLALRGKPLVPVRDPRLDEALNFENL
jgi:hypothetical protein